MVLSLINILMDKLVEFLEREYMEEEVRVEIIGKTTRVFAYEGLVELMRGAEYSVPRWLANILVSENIARVKEQELGIDKLSTIAYNEESLVQKLQLVKIPRYFYLNINRIVRDLENRLKKEIDLSILDDIKKFEELLYTIGRIRVKKILNMVLLTSLPQDTVDKLSEEEKILYNSFKGLLSIWMKKLNLEK
ncbi:MAG: hypothetical protein QXP71_03740 [Desulfurococcaceae archaeon]|uniref:DNA replication complex GINS family protein n=1 Tax=Staphylothermus marinus TaxID=2280 RepID=A0A7C4DA39_STAMA